jgi:hypothetical protein
LMGEFRPLTFSVSIDNNVVIPVIYLSLLFKCLIVCSWMNVTLWFLEGQAVPVVWYCLSFHGFVCFHFVCADFLEDSFVVLTWWSYIVLVSVYLEDFYCSIYFEW